MFGWLRKKNDEATRGEDHVWLSDAARVEGLRREVERGAANGGNVVVVAPTMAVFDRMAEALAQQQPRLCRDQFERTALHQALEGDSVVALAMASSLPNQSKAGSNARAAFLVFGRNATRSADEAIAHAADLLGPRSSVTFHLSFDDVLLQQHAKAVKPLLEKLGQSAGEAVTSPYLTRAIANAQAK